MTRPHNRLAALTAPRFMVMVAFTLSATSCTLAAGSVQGKSSGSLPYGYTDWGQIMNYARNWLDGPYWYVTVFPAAFIILFSLGWNLFGDAVRDAFDPRTR